MAKSGSSEPTVKLEFQDFGTRNAGNGNIPAGKMDRPSPSSATESLGFEGQTLLGSTPQSSAPVPNAPFWNINYYKPFFDIDTKDVLYRLLYALWPWKSPIFEQIPLQPDMYGPVWICTTLVFMMGVTSNFASWASFQADEDNPSWTYDFTKITVGASVVYGFMVVVPVAVWGLMKYFESTVRYIETLSVYGYSMLIYVPISIFCIPDIDWLRWLLVVLSLLYSLIFLFLNLRSHLPAKGLLAVGLVVIATHVGLALAFKLYLFKL